MTYCVSDLHGEYHLFCRLMQKIRFSTSDRLIVCGDVLDKGKDYLFDGKSRIRFFEILLGVDGAIP